MNFGLTETSTETGEVTEGSSFKGWGLPIRSSLVKIDRKKGRILCLVGPQGRREGAVIRKLRP